MPIKVYNTLTKRKEEFMPMVPGVVQMFVCGPTVYDVSHVGHAKTMTQFDFVARYLTHRGYSVTYVQNITDIDDKIIRRAAELNVTPQDLAAKYEALYLEDMAVLHNTNVTIFARAHDYIEAIVRQIQQLIKRGHAYQLDDGWYFDLSTFPDYGKLSGRRSVQADDAVSRIDENDRKRNPGDFALWKARKPGEPYWDTPLGQGRPGWHIEDTAITDSIFGPQYDVHGGATDLAFPHHEAEIAQLESASGKSPLSRYWMHAGLLRVNGAKMGKSAGNFMTIRDAFQLADFRTLRYVFLSQHYRSTMELNKSVLESARNARRRVENFARSIDASRLEEGEDITLVKRFRAHFFERLDDDFDTPGALAVLFGFIREHNRGTVTPGQSAYAFLREVNELFDAFNLETREVENAKIEAVLAKRRELREARKFAEADTIREELRQCGVMIEDTVDRTRWWFETGSS